MIGTAVDLRPALLPVRNQGKRCSCLAFAGSAAHEHKLVAGGHLSVEYLFFHAVARSAVSLPGAGATMVGMQAALASDGQPEEAAWPYSAEQPDPWSPPPVRSAIHKAGLVLCDPTFDGVVGLLSRGSPVVLGLVITDAFYRPGPGGIVADARPDAAGAGHAVLAVGHGNAPGIGRALLVRNSWGDGWGIGGHAWLPAAYVARQIHEAATLGKADAWT